MSRGREKGICAALLALAAAFLAPARAEERDPFEVPNNDAHPAEDPEGDAALKRGDEAAQKGDFRRAIEAWQPVIERESAGLFPVEPGRYLSISEAAGRRILDLPPEGRALYRMSYEPIAGRVLREGAADRGPDGEAALERVFRRYPATAAAAAAGLLLADRRLESGSWLQALRAAEDLLRRAPALPEGTVSPEGVFARIALARRLCAGEAAVLPPSPAGPIPVGGASLPADRFLSALKAIPPPPLPAPLEDEWWMEGGSPARSAVMSGEPAAADRALVYEWPKPFGGAAAAPGGLSPSPVVLPAVSGGTLFYNDGAGLTALDLDSGKLQGKRDFKEGNAAFLAPPGFNPLHHAVVSAGLVLAVSRPPGPSQPNPWTGGMEMGGAGNALTCVDARTFKLKWQAEYWREDPDSGPERGYFASAPVVYDGFVYVVACVRGDLHLLKIDAARGMDPPALKGARPRPRWSRFLSSTGAAVSAFPTMASPPAAGDGSVYIITNTGCVAAVDAASGAVRWYLRYERPAFPEGRRVHPILVGGQLYQNYLPPFLSEPSPPILFEGKVIAAPADTDHLYAFDAATGRLAWKAKRNDETSRPGVALGMRHLAGVSGSDDPRVVFVGSQRAIAFSARTGRRKWETSLASGGETTVGRAAATDQRVYVCVQDRAGTSSLRAVDVRTGKVAENIQLKGPSKDEKNLGGAILLLNGHLVIAGAQGIYSYPSPASQIKRVQAQLKDDPRNPDHHFRLGTILDTNGDLEGAAAEMEEALRLLETAPTGAVWRTSRGEAAGTLVQILRKSARGQAEAGRGAAARAALERALGIASSPEAEQGVLRDLLGLLEKTGDRSPLLRTAARLASHDTGLSAESPDFARSPAAAAREWVERAWPSLKDAERAPFEEQARAALAAARAKPGGDPKGLAAIRWTHPRSTAAREALTAALLAAGDDPGRASNLALALLRDFPESPEAAEALDLLAAQADAAPEGALDLAAAAAAQRAAAGRPAPEPFKARTAASLLRPAFDVAEKRIPGTTLALHDGILLQKEGSALSAYRPEGFKAWRKEMGWMGIRMNDVEGGVQVVQAFRGEPADLAGLRAGDVIQKFNGRPVQDKNALKDAAADTEPRTKVLLDILRGGASREVELVIDRMPRDYDMSQQEILGVAAAGGSVWFLRRGGAQGVELKTGRTLARVEVPLDPSAALPAPLPGRPETLRGGIAAGGKTVLYHHRKGMLFLEADTGKRSAEHPPRPMHHAARAPMFQGGRFLAFTGFGGRTVVAVFDPANVAGKPLEVEIAGKFSQAEAVGAAVFIATTKGLFRLAPAEGKLSVCAVEETRAFAAVRPILLADAFDLVVQTDGGRLLDLDPAALKERWKATPFARGAADREGEPASPPEPLGAARAGEVLLVAAEEAAPEAGRAPAARRTRVFLLSALDLATGRILHQRKVEGEFLVGPVAAGGGAAYAAGRLASRPGLAGAGTLGGTLTFFDPVTGRIAGESTLPAVAAIPDALALENRGGVLQLTTGEFLLIATPLPPPPPPR